MKKHKVQVTVYFMVVIATIIVITMIVINIGKIARDKTHADNAADAGALAGGSVGAYAFNYVAEANKDEDKRFEGNYNDFIDAMDQYVDTIEQRKNDIVTTIENQLIPPPCCNFSVCGVPPQALLLAMMDIGPTKQFPMGTYRRDMYELIKVEGDDSTTGQQEQAGQELGVIPNYWKLQADFLYAVKERVQDDGSTGGGEDLYSDALTACYKYNLYNCGFPVKMGEDAKEFYEWVDSLEPTNCTPETYNWTDGAGRTHTVTATCCIEDWLTWEVNHTQMNRQEEKDKLQEADDKAQEAYDKVMQGASDDAWSCACLPFEPCTTIPGCDSCEADSNANDAFNEAIQKMEESFQKVQEARQGLERGGSQTITTKDGMDEYIITDLEDITSNPGRVVQSNNFQFHMGGVVKGGRGDMDTPTFYPPTQSSAMASFQGDGSIPDKNPAHDVSLISAN